MGLNIAERMAIMNNKNLILFKKTWFTFLKQVVCDYDMVISNVR